MVSKFLIYILPTDIYEMTLLLSFYYYFTSIQPQKGNPLPPNFSKKCTNLCGMSQLVISRLILMSQLLLKVKYCQKIQFDHLPALTKLSALPIKVSFIYIHIYIFISFFILLKKFQMYICNKITNELTDTLFTCACM